MKINRVHILTLSFGCALALVLISACRNTPRQSHHNDVLVQVGDSVLTVDRVVQKIPQGLSYADSLAMFDAIVEDWLRERLLCDIAMGNLPHPEIIEQRVQDYRNRLIAIEYRKLLGYKPGEADEDTVRSFYDHHTEDMKLNAPIVRGLYIKVPANDPEIDNIRRWIAQANPQSIDKLEKHSVQNAMQYDHFTDRWVDWQTVADQIPYRFGDADAFLTKGKVFETEHNDILYLMHITDVMHTGQQMPYEYAAVQIRTMMADNDRAEYDNRLFRDLYDKAIKDKRIVDNRK